MQKQKTVDKLCQVADSSCMNNVKQIRELKNLTVLQLAQMAKTSAQSIYYIEKGGMPRRPLRARLAMALNVTMSELFNS